MNHYSLSTAIWNKVSETVNKEELDCSHPKMSRNQDFSSKHDLSATHKGCNVLDIENSNELKQ